MNQKKKMMNTVRAKGKAYRYLVQTRLGGVTFDNTIAVVVVALVEVH